MPFIINEKDKRMETIMPEIHKCMYDCPEGETSLLLNKIDSGLISNQHLLKCKERLIGGSIAQNAN